MDPPATMPTEHESARFDDLNFTVHEYHHSTYLPSRTSQTAIVNEAYQLLKGVISGYIKWTSRATGFPTLKTTGSSNCFTLVQRPPAFEIAVKGERIDKEWGSALTEDEIFELSDLEDFVGTDLTYLLERKQKRTKPDLEESNDEEVGNSHLMEEQASKKRKLNLAPLYYLIPQPHMLPSPFLPSEPPLVYAKFSSAEPRFVSPYSSLSLSDDARVAWLIPIRGVLPWDDCSSATLLEDDFDYPSIPFDGYNTQILWTSELLLRFWDFLRDLRTSGTVGSLGISFHASQNSQRARAMLANHKLPPFSTPLPTLTSNSVPGSAGPRTTLLASDHIKVYHDLRRRLHLRQLLDEWHSVQVAVLKHARLVLLDEASQAILVL
ncbi:hypothetical protein BJ912DRAFT_926500 [Pholiota molesta]|nr:hypothetical protein BJ912DRAFT_926500 [Pholiota molesta]